MGIESSEYIPQEGAVEEFEGDVVVADEPDSIGWNRERYDHGPKTDYVIKGAAVKAAHRVLGEYKFVEPMMLSQAELDGDDTEDEGTMSLSVRITMAKERFGFMPTTHRELNNLIGLKGEDRISDADTHIERVQRRNVRKNRDKVEATKDLPIEDQVNFDPTLARRTAEKIVGEYASYANTAINHGRLLLGLQDMLSSSYKRSESAASTSLLRDWTVDDSIKVPIMALMKSNDIKAYTIDDTDKDSPLQIDYTKLRSNELRSLGDSYIKGITIGQLQEQIATLVGEQRSRFRFWRKALEESIPNGGARDSALAALKKLKLA